MKFNDYGISTLADLDRDPLHPDYSGCTFPPGGGDRCTCGGVRHWHAKPPYGCDDCEGCAEFTAAPLEPTEAEVRERVAREIEAAGATAAQSQRESDLSLGVEPIGTSTPNEAEWYQFSNWAAHIARSKS